MKSAKTYLLPLGRLVVTGLLIGDCLLLAAQPPSAPVYEWKKQAEELIQTGRSQEAMKLLNKAERGASTLEERTESRLLTARLLAHGTERQQWMRAAEIYQQVILDLSDRPSLYADRRELSPALLSLKLQAHNNYSGVLLKLGNADKAVEVLASIETAMAQPEQRKRRPLYLYNYGCAQEAMGQKDLAYKLFMESLSLEPQLAPASQGAYRVSLSSSSERTGIPEMKGLIQTVILQGDLGTAERYLETTLTTPHWRGHPLYAQIQVVLAEYLAAAQVTSAQFNQKWKPLLERLQPSLPARDAQRFLDLVRAYNGELPVVLRPWEVQNLFSTWGENKDQRAAISRLLKQAGDGLMASGNPKLALERYSVAWSFFPENSEAALYLANLLAESKEQIDPQGRLLNILIESLFQSKGEAYLGNDWANILRFHAILGSIFEKRQQWGDSYNPSSAVFQWEHALQAYHRLQTSEPANYTRVPGLHERLATAYQAVGRSKDAYAQWITAAEGFSGLQQYQGAQKAIQRADLLPAPSDNNLRIKRQQILNSIPAAP
jgi:hypothetical protein